MKNKTTTYVLMAVVLLIWGYIVYKIYLGVTGEDVPKPIVAAKNTSAKAQKPLLLNNYELALNYRDPFLGKSSQPIAFQGSQASNVPVTQRPRPQARIEKPITPKPVEVIDWSFIQFKGIMKNPNTQRMVSIVFVNGNQYMLEEGAVGGGVKILKVYKDSLKISYNNVKKTITR